MSPGARTAASGGGGGVVGVLRRALTENLGLKALSLGVALGVFWLVHGTENAQRPFFVDVVTIMPQSGSGWILMSEIPDKVRVTLKGSRSVINALRRDDLGPVQVDLHGADRRYHYFEPSSFDLPAGVEVVSIEPASVQLVWARRIERRSTVVAQVTGRLRAGLQLRDGVVVEPTSIQVSGPEGVVQHLVTVETEPIDLSVFDVGRHERVVPLVEAGEHVSYGDAATAHVTLDVVAEVHERRWRERAVALVGSAARVSVRPAAVDVRLRGPPGTLDDVDSEHLVPFVDLEGLDVTHGATAVRVQLRGVPSGLEIVGVDPPEVLVAPRR